MWDLMRVEEQVGRPAAAPIRPGQEGWPALKPLSFLPGDTHVLQQDCTPKPAAHPPACLPSAPTLAALPLPPRPQVGMGLTESLAMLPAASVSGLYFASPAAQYFAVGKITKEQVADYAARKRMPVEEAERWLRTMLEYEP